MDETAYLNQQQITKYLNRQQLKRANVDQSTAPVNKITQPFSNAINTAKASSGRTSTQAPLTHSRKQEPGPQPWETNSSVSFLTNTLNVQVPDMQTIIEAQGMLSLPNMFAIRAGAKSGPRLMEIVKSLQATKQKNANELQQLLVNQQAHEFAKQKFLYEQQQDQLDYARDMAAKGHEAFGETYRMVLKMADDLTPESLTRLMTRFSNEADTIAMIPDAPSAYKFASEVIAEEGLTFREKGTKIDVPKFSKIDERVVNGKIVYVQEDQFGNVRYQKTDIPAPTAEKYPVGGVVKRNGKNMQGVFNKGTGQIEWVDAGEIEEDVKEPKTTVRDYKEGSFVVNKETGEATPVTSEGIPLTPNKEESFADKIKRTMEEAARKKQMEEQVAPEEVSKDKPKKGNSFWDGF